MKLLRKLTLPMILAVMLFAISGCDQVTELADDLKDMAGGTEDSTGDAVHTDTPEAKGQTINEYFTGQTVNFYRQSDMVITCESGDCPESEKGELLDQPCFFCESGSEVYHDYMIVHITPISSMDSLGSCVDKSDFTYPERLTIVEKTEDMIVAEGTGKGTASRQGTGCDETYEYSFTTNEQWIFTTTDLAALVEMDVYTGAPQGNLPNQTRYYIDAPGWDNPPTEPLRYSHFGITITGKSDYPFRFLTEIRLIRIEGYDRTPSVLRKDIKELNENSTEYHFAASFNGEYVVKPVLKVIGRNGAVLNEIISDAEYIIRVTDSPQGDLP